MHIYININIYEYNTYALINICMYIHIKTHSHVLWGGKDKNAF